jgi:murein DD-endopeptidase MepM/ murein hydrolase activator NlpD
MLFSPGRMVAVLVSAGLTSVAVAEAMPRQSRSVTPSAHGSYDTAPALAPAYGTYGWPVAGPVIRPFEPPESPFGSGHRGIDVGAAPGTPVRAAHHGVVAFAGPVAGALYVSIDHADGVRTTYSWMGEVGVRRGSTVARGQIIGSSGAGHPGVEPSHLHFGARFAGEYIDPMLLLERRSVVGLIRLAPLEEGGAEG